MSAGKTEGDGVVTLFTFLVVLLLTTLARGVLGAVVGIARLTQLLGSAS